MKPVGYYIGYYGVSVVGAVLLVSALYALGKKLFGLIIRKR